MLSQQRHDSGSDDSMGIAAETNTPSASVSRSFRLSKSTGNISGSLDPSTAALRNRLPSHSNDSIAALAGPAFISQSSENVVGASTNNLPGSDHTNATRILRPSQSTGNIKIVSVRVSGGDGLLYDGMSSISIDIQNYILFY